MLLQNDACSLLAADALMRGGARWEFSGPSLTPALFPDGVIPGSEGFWGRWRWWWWGGGVVPGETWGSVLRSSAQPIASSAGCSRYTDRER